MQPRVAIEVVVVVVHSLAAFPGCWKFGDGYTLDDNRWLYQVLRERKRLSATPDALKTHRKREMPHDERCTQRKAYPPLQKEIRVHETGEIKPAPEPVATLRPLITSSVGSRGHTAQPAPRRVRVTACNMVAWRRVAWRVAWRVLVPWVRVWAREARQT